jgi:hypothetical protein
LASSSRGDVCRFAAVATIGAGGMGEALTTLKVQ